MDETELIEKDHDPEVSMPIEFKPEPREGKPRITVIGVGGAGGNAVNNMIAGKLEGVEFVVANTDAQALEQSLAEHRVQLGASITHGLGAGARPDIGKVSAEEAVNELQRYLEGNNMVFIAAGMGGGTGTGAAPVIARTAQEQGILTVGVVTKPFQFEGIHRMKLAEQGILELQKYVDTLIVIPNQNLFRIANERTTFADAFKLADDVLHAGVRGVTDLMVNPGLINLDFADVRTVMEEMGKAMMGTGEATGDNRAIEAAEAAINNPLLDNASIEGARGVLINITGSADMTLHEVDLAASRICKEVDETANVIFGARLDPSMEGSIRVAVIATGIDALKEREPVPTEKIYVLGQPPRRQAASPAMAPVAQHEPVFAAVAEAPVSAAVAASPMAARSPAAVAVSEAYAAVSRAEPVPVAPPAPAPAPTPAAVRAAQAMAEARLPLESPARPAAEPPMRAAAEPAGAPVPAPARRVEAQGPVSPRPATSAPFVPPPPVEPPARPAAQGGRVEAPVPEVAAELVGAARQQQLKRGPGLFQRITGATRAARAEPEDQPPAAPAAAAAQPAPGREPMLGAMTRPARAQEPAPKLPQPAEDPLEIPAFLRRQAN
jgi:cell division protein FtsZ